MSAYSDSPPVDDEEDAAEREERLPRVLREEVDDVDRVDRAEDRRLTQDLAEAEHSDHGEPDHHHRTEDPADLAGALRLEDEQPIRIAHAIGIT
jgi:hypothetical protein